MDSMLVALYGENAPDVLEYADWPEALRRRTSSVRAVMRMFDPDSSAGVLYCVQCISATGKRGMIGWHNLCDLVRTLETVERLGMLLPPPRSA